jgi:hypothetical protein
MTDHALMLMIAIKVIMVIGLVISYYWIWRRFKNDDK